MGMPSKIIKENLSKWWEIQWVYPELKELVRLVLLLVTSKGGIEVKWGVVWRVIAIVYACSLVMDSPLVCEMKWHAVLKLEMLCFCTAQLEFVAFTNCHPPFQNPERGSCWQYALSKCFVTGQNYLSQGNRATCQMTYIQGSVAAKGIGFLIDVRGDGSEEWREYVKREIIRPESPAPQNEAMY